METAIAEFLIDNETFEERVTAEQCQNEMDLHLSEEYFSFSDEKKMKNIFSQIEYIPTTLAIAAISYAWEKVNWDEVAMIVNNQK